MRVWVWILLGTSLAATSAAYAEFVLDIRTARSHLSYGSAFASIIAFPSEEPEKKHLAGMYGLFLIAPNDANESIFPFSIVPGSASLSSHKPTIANLRSRFESFGEKLAIARDEDSFTDSCESKAPSELGFRELATWLHLRSQSSCIVHQTGSPQSSMLISVTLADGDPWMRPFARWICKTMTATALKEIALAHRERPTYAACVLVDRPTKIRPGDPKDTFTTVVFEVGTHTLARLD